MTIGYAYQWAITYSNIILIMILIMFYPIINVLLLVMQQC